MEKQRTALFVLLTAVGVALLMYGLFYHDAAVSSGEQGQVTTKSELAVTREVARGGVERDESGAVKQTYAPGEEAPAACPT